jgi:hypothetical protein
LIWFLGTQGWTIFEILRYMPEHNWSAYEEALKANPVLAKMMISGVVYSLGDWIAQVPSHFNSTATLPLFNKTSISVITDCRCFLLLMLAVLRRQADI